MAPESLVDHRQRQALELAWADGTRALLSYRRLREQCPCADCKVLRSQGCPPAPLSDIGVAELRPVGHYGLQLVFSDGHERGIYPWALLRAQASVGAAAPG